MHDTLHLHYVGASGAGKRTNLAWIQERGAAAAKGGLTLDLGRLGGVPATITVTAGGLDGLSQARLDGVVVVCDSSPTQLPANRRACEAVWRALEGRSGPPLPVVLQWNKRDLDDLIPLPELERRLNPRHVPAFPACARAGEGVLPTLGALVGMVLAQRNHSPVQQDLSRTVIEELELPGLDLPPTADLHVGAHVGPCQIISKLGEGGMGAVYLARHANLGKQVVVKTLKPALARDPRRVRRFFLEARAAARLEHPHIVAVKDVGTTREGLHYIVMQHVEGDDLRRRVAERGPLAPAPALQVVLAVAQALEALHAAGIVHRDVKSENVVVTPAGGVKLIDFGLAKDLRAQANLTRAGALIGTPAYMAPEIGRVVDIDGRVDIYSLGLTFYQLLTGLQPFDGFTLHAVILGRARLFPPSDVVPDLDPAYTRLLERMLAWDRDQRYPSAQALLADMRALQAGKPLVAPCPGARVFDLAVARKALGRDPRPIPPTLVPGAEPVTREVRRDPTPRLAAPPEGAVTRVEPGPSLGAESPSTHRLGRYLVLGELERGLDFVVFRCWDPDALRHVRLRRVEGAAEVSPDGLRELRDAARFQHPRSPRFLGHEPLGDSRLLITDDVGARPLSDLLNVGGPVDAGALARAAADVARTLACLHDLGHVHGGVRPHSLGIDASGRGALLDADLAALRRGQGARSSARLGDDSCAPPECRSGRRPTPRSDVFALGAALAALLPAQETRLARDLEAICLRAREPRPEGRYGDMHAFADDLLRALRGEVPRAHPWRHRVRTIASRAGALPPWARVAGAAMAVALVAALHTAWSQARLAEAKTVRLKAVLSGLEK
jgi:serine/threonine protein kinase